METKNLKKWEFLSQKQLSFFLNHADEDVFCFDAFLVILSNLKQI